MSTLLEQAIVDAEALKEVALKNAETRILEKYSAEVKNALNTLLEQEEEDPFDLGGGEEGGEELGGDLDLGGDLGGELGGDEIAGEEPVAKDMPNAFADGEKLCPCPDEEEEIEIDFNDLARQLQDPEEGAVEGDIADREEEMGFDAEEEEEEGMGALMEQFEELLAQAIAEEINLDGDLQSSGYSGTTPAQAQDAAMLDMAKTLVDADPKDTKDFEDEELGDIVVGDNEPDEVNLVLQREKERLAERLENTKALSRGQISDLRKQNKGLKQKISTLQEQVLKVNLVNAKLLYTNKTLKDISLNGRQKKQIVESLTRASSVEEAKTIYETLQSTVSSAPEKRTPSSLSEAVNRGRASTLFAGRREKQDKPTEDPMLSKWRVLAGLAKE